MAKQQFRPYLTLDQLQYLISITSTDTNPIGIKLNSYLKVFALKAGAGLVTTHTTTRESIAEKLGLESTSLSPGEKRRILFEQWQADPNSVSISDMALVQTYRYENGLMSDHESSEFESSLMI